MIATFPETLQYGEQIKALVLRDLKVKYKGSVLGYAWTWLDPLGTMFVLILVFDVFLSLGIENFAIYLLCGLLPWTFFSNCVNESVNSIINSSYLIKRIYYPRDIFPLTIVLGHAVNFLLNLAVLLPVLLLFGIPPSPRILLLAVPAFFLFLFTLGISYFLASLNVFFRDISYITPFVTRLLFFLTPIFYEIDGTIPDRLLDIYMILNPLAPFLSLFRHLLMGSPPPALLYVLSASLTSMVLFLLGYLFFKRHESTMIKFI